MAQRIYDREFKISAINLYKKGKRIADISRDLGIPDTTFHYWLKQEMENQEDFLRGSGKPKVSNQETVRLKKALEAVTLERDILKKAVAIFSRRKQ